MASSNFPRRRATAPVKAPFSWPNSSDSKRFSGIAAQFTAMKEAGGAVFKEKGTAMKQIGKKWATLSDADKGSWKAKADAKNAAAGAEVVGGSGSAQPEGDDDDDDDDDDSDDEEEEEESPRKKKKKKKKEKKRQRQ